MDDLPAAVQTRACVGVLGLPVGLQAVAEAGLSHIVLFAGESGEFVSGLEIAPKLGLTTLALALPKIRSEELAAPRTSRMLDEATSAGVRVSLIFGEPATALRDDPGWRSFCARLRALHGLVIENNGGAGERFASPSDIAHLLDAVPDAKLALDVAHLQCAGGDVVELAPYWERVAWVEVHDNDGVHDQHLPLGRGTGLGRFELALRRLRWLPKRIVIETSPDVAPERTAWVEAMRSDAERLRMALASQRPLEQAVTQR
jgi:sugar phosphate isomerase/epimerase